MNHVVESVSVALVFVLVRRDVKQLAVGASCVGCRFSGIDCTHDLLMPAHFSLVLGELFFHDTQDSNYEPLSSESFVSIVLFHGLLVGVNEGKRHFTELESNKTSNIGVSSWKMQIFETTQETHFQ